MHRQISKCAYFQSTVFTILLTMFSLNVFAQQTAKTPQCAETDYNCLIAKYEKEGKLNPQVSTAYYRRAGEFIEQKSYEPAMKDYDTAISLNPKFNEAYDGRGYIYLQLKLYVEATKEFNRAKELNPTDSYALENLKSIDEFIERGGLPVEEYDKLIETEPAKAEYYLGRANRYLKTNNFDNAFMDSAKTFILNKIIEDAGKAIEINQNFAEAYYARAVGYCNFGRRKESKAAIEKYDKLSGKTTKEKCLISIYTCTGGDENCLMNIFTDGINNPSEIGHGSLNNLDNYYRWRGNLYYKSGDLDRALSDFNDAFNVNGYTEYLNRGNIYFLKGKYDEALKDFYRSLGNSATSAEANYGIGEIKLIKREYKSALAYFDKAIIYNSRLSRAYLGRGTIYLEFGKNHAGNENNEETPVDYYKKAIKNFDNVIETDLKDANPEVYLRRAEAYEKLGEQAKADADRAKYGELTSNHH